MMLVINAPAKINWFLRVSDRRGDGYHNIVSLMQFITLQDSITLEESDDIAVLTEAAIPAQENLVFKAAMMLKATTGAQKGAKISLKKDIPLSAGLGGGSSDAAAVLKGLNQLWRLNLSFNELSEFCARLGSDVPFFFGGPAALIKGKGEEVTPVVLKRPYTILLVKPAFGINAAWAYREFDACADRQGLTKKHNNIKLFCHALDIGDFSFLSDISVNDLEKGVFREYPVLKDIKQELLWNGARFSAMSGSGSTVFGVFEDEHSALYAMHQMSHDNWCRVVKTIV